MLKKASLAAMLPHKKTDPERVKSIVDEMNQSNVLHRPVAVYNLLHYGKKDTYLVVNGHHRIEALRTLGCAYVFASTIDFGEPFFKVFSQEGEKEWTKEEIINRAISGDLLEVDSTKMVVLVGDTYIPIQENNAIEPKLEYKLKFLKGP